MTLDFSDVLLHLDDDPFEEKPVDLETFLNDPYYIDIPPLSENQTRAVRAMTQIFKKETLVGLYGPEKGAQRASETFNEVILVAGKGSGKDMLSTVAVTYIVYQLLCLKDPAKYFGKPAGDAIDIINVAINADQARNVFFKGLKQRITKSKWFKGKYKIANNAIQFQKSVTCHSGHSEREAWEGYNFLVVILDEISGFAATGIGASDKTSQAIYDMYRASVDSRFPDIGKLALLSFPREKNDFIQERYDMVVSEKQVREMQHTFLLDEELPVDHEGNSFTIDWVEEDVVSYTMPKMWALKRPTWEMNPTRSINDFKNAFFSNPNDAIGRFAAQPVEAIDAFFSNAEKVRNCFDQTNNGIDSTGRLQEWFAPQEGERYYLHVDLAQKRDRAALAMSHVSHWEKVAVIMGNDIMRPRVKIDVINWWTPTRTESINFSHIREFILDLKRAGFDIGLVTFDRWQSHDIMTELEGYGVKTQVLSVGKKHYEDFSVLVAEERISGPHIDILERELLQLKVVKNNVDHPRSGSKDLADAVCGSVFNAITLTPKTHGIPEISGIKTSGKRYRSI